MTNDDPGRVGRRRVLQAVAGAGLLAGGFATGTAAAAPGEQQWAFETGGIVRSSPAVVDGTVFVGSWDNNLYAVEAATGEQQWVFEIADAVDSSPVVADGTVYVGSGYGNILYAVDAATGEQQWAFGPVNFVSPPAVADGTVYVGSFPNLYAVDAATGDQQWAFETESVVTSPPAVADGTVFVGSRDFNLYAVDAATGEQQWAFETGGDVTSSPAVVNGTVFVGNWYSNLYAVDAATGDQQWAFQTGAGVRSSPAVADGTVFVGSDDTNLYAVDAATGDQQWAFETDNWVRSSPAVADGTVFVGSDDTNLYAVEADVTRGDGTESIDTFDIRDHGLGFANWAGKRGCATSTVTLPENCSTENTFSLEYDLIDLATVRDNVSQWASVPGKLATDLIARSIYQMIVRQTASGGHCYGMVFAAQEYFQNPDKLPGGIETASEVSRPTGEFEAVGERIRSYHTSQQISFESKWKTVYGVIFDQMDLAGSIDAVTSGLDENETIVLQLGTFDPPAYEGHQLLAYDYEEVDGSINIYCYDPNFAADADQYQQDPPAPGLLVADAETGELTAPYRGIYDTYAPIAPSVSLSLAEQAVPDTVFERFDMGSVFTLNSPASLNVDAPDNATVVSATSGLVYDEPMADARVVLDAPPTECSVDVVGEGDGEYTFEAFGIRNGETVVDDQVTGTISDGETIRYDLMPLKGNGEAQLTETDVDNSENDDSNGGEGLSLPGPGVPGALAALGGAGYWLARRRNKQTDDTDEPAK